MAPAESEQWDRFSHKIDRGLSRYLTRPLYARLLDLAAPEPGVRLLDVGSGSGTFVLQAVARGAEALGVDASDAMVRVAAAKGPGRFVVGGAERLPFADRSFDVVTTSLSMHHWESAEDGLREIRRVLRPSGRFVVADVERAGALARLHNTCRAHHSHGRYLRQDEYDEVLAGTGLVRVSQERLRRRWVLTTATPA